MDAERPPVAGVDYPRSIQEFESRFADEASCRAYLMRLRWPRGVPLSPLWFDKAAVADRTGPDALRGLRPTGVCHCGHGIRGYAQASSLLVPGDVVRHEPETRGECARVEAGA